MEGCIFCKIARDEMPSALVYQDEKAVIFLDRNQAAKGHMLLVPRSHAVYWHELEEETAAHLGRLAAEFAPIVVEALQADGYNLLQNNGEAAEQEVMHVHLHLIPRWKGDKYFGSDTKYRMADAEELRATASVIHQQRRVGVGGSTSLPDGEES